jgi:DNA-binding NtrC family response regulator
MTLANPPEESMKPVWIVDDDKSIRWVLEKTLSREKIPFQSFSSATEALARLDAGAEAPQILVSDIRMPGQSRPRTATPVVQGARIPAICRSSS